MKSLEGNFCLFSECCDLTNFCDIFLTLNILVKILKKFVKSHDGFFLFIFVSCDLTNFSDIAEF